MNDPATEQYRPQLDLDQAERDAERAALFITIAAIGVWVVIAIVGVFVWLSIG